MGWIQFIDRSPEAGDTWLPCDCCAGAGSNGRDNEPTDRAHLNGDTPMMAIQGYVPTNLCEQCHGEGGTWLPKRRPWRNHRRWPTFADQIANNNVCSLIQSWRSEVGAWMPSMTEEMRAGFVCEFANDADAPQEVAV